MSFASAYEVIPAILASRTMVNGKCPDEKKNVACRDKCCPLPYVIFVICNLCIKFLSENIGVFSLIL